MKSKISVHIALLMLCAVSFTAALADAPVNLKQKLPSLWARPGQWVPDKSVRNRANLLDENRITAMSIGGTFIGVDGDNPNIALKDKWIIHMFVDALRNAQWWSGNPEMAGNLNAYIAFGYKDLKEGEVNPEFPLNFGGVNQHFGPPFERTLLKLAEYRASELRNFVKRNAKEVVSLVITEGKTLALPSDLRFVLKDLTKLKASDGEDYLNGGEDRKLTITLKDGKKVSFYLSIRGQPKEKPVRPDPFFVSAFWQMTQPEPVKK